MTAPVVAAFNEFVSIYPLVGRGLFFHGNGLVEVCPFDGSLRLSGIMVNDGLRQQGHGTAVMRRLLAIADKHGVCVTASMQPFGRGKVMTVGKLRRWYKSLGFHCPRNARDITYHKERK